MNSPNRQSAALSVIPPAGNAGHSSSHHGARFDAAFSEFSDTGWGAKKPTVGGERETAVRSLDRGPRAARAGFDKALLRHAEGAMVSSTVRSLHLHRPEIERRIDKALQFGPLATLGHANLALEHITAGYRRVLESPLAARSAVARYGAGGARMG